MNRTQKNQNRLQGLGTQPRYLYQSVKSTIYCTDKPTIEPYLQPGDMPLIFARVLLLNRPFFERCRASRSRIFLSPLASLVLKVENFFFYFFIFLLTPYNGIEYARNACGQSISRMASHHWKDDGCRCQGSIELFDFGNLMSLTAHPPKSPKLSNGCAQAGRLFGSPS